MSLLAGDLLAISSPSGRRKDKTDGHAAGFWVQYFSRLERAEAMSLVTMLLVQPSCRKKMPCPTLPERRAEGHVLPIALNGSKF
jgi:hypothetical protein